MENIQELSYGTLKSYASKAIAASKDDSAASRLKAKRQSGFGKALSKLATEGEKNTADNNKTRSKGFVKSAEDHLTKHGYEKMHETKGKSSTWLKHDHDNNMLHTARITHGHEGKGYDRDGHVGHIQVTSCDGNSSSHQGHISRSYEPDNHDEVHKETHRHIGDMLKNHHERATKTGSWAPSLHEETEQLDEVSKETLQSYSARARRSGTREKGLIKAKEKLKKIYHDEEKAHQKAHNLGFSAAAHAKLREYGFHRHHETGKSTTYVRHDKETNHMHIAKLVHDDVDSPILGIASSDGTNTSKQAEYHPMGAGADNAESIGGAISRHMRAHHEKIKSGHHANINEEVSAPIVENTMNRTELKLLSLVLKD